jgi:hypothetical protein
MVALKRIATVYQEAQHVLVLDKSISSFASEGMHSAEICCRRVAFSTWMRRLWTLQGWLPGPPPIPNIRH